MAVSSRFFVVADGEIKKLSQKKAGDFYFQDKNSLPDYAGKTISIAHVVVEIINRKPSNIISTDCLKTKDDENGGMHTSYREESL